jgi:hypothetical protein
VRPVSRIQTEEDGMTEFALLTATGEIANVCTTTMTMAEIQKRTPQYKVVLLDSVPTSVKVLYQYWNERP